jgi:hypothetical protein
MPDGSRAPPDVKHWYAVSRHGLARQGITCHLCGHVVASKDDSSVIRVTKLGEAVFCPDCRVGFLASPDDAVDPVTPTSGYDPEVYHRFVRSSPEAPPRQLTEEGIPEVGDWVVFTGHVFAVPGNKASDVIGCEGRVVGISEERFRIALAGNTGLGGSGDFGGAWVEATSAQIARMLTPSLAPGHQVRVIKGLHLGKCGEILALERSMVSVALADDTRATLPIEHVVKLPRRS